MTRRFNKSIQVCAAGTYYDFLDCEWGLWDGILWVFYAGKEVGCFSAPFALKVVA